MTCPSCKRDFTPELHPGGRCEEVNHGRRFFMMGALALPLAKKVTLAAPAVTMESEYVITRDAAGLYRVTYHWRDLVSGQSGTRTTASSFAMVPITSYFALAK